MNTRDALLTFAPGILLVVLPVLLGVAAALLTPGCIDVKIPSKFHHTHDVNVRVLDDTGDTSSFLSDSI